MDEAVLLLNMTLLLLVAGVCSVIFKKLRMPAIIGYLATGIILANYWTGESADTELIVTMLADLGLVLLMFCIGLELNLKKLKKTGGFAMMVVMIQLPLMLIGGYAFGILMGFNPLQAIVFGAIISGSSTAVVTLVLKEQKKLTRDDMETIVLITVIEDVAQVLILSMLSPMLIGESSSIDSMLWMILTIILFIGAGTVIGLMFIPKALDWIGNKMPSEILLITSLGLCFGMSLLSVWVGLSMAIGAFMMGMIVSQSKMNRAIEHDVTPMKNIFMAMFFISIGLQIAPNSLINNIGMIMAIFAIYAILKFGSVMVAYFVGNKPLRLGFVSSLTLVAMGEFAFIIAKEAFDAGIIDNAMYTSVIGAALVSMIVMPIIAKESEKICDVAVKKAPKKLLVTVDNFVQRRNESYEKLSLTSKTTLGRMKKKATMAYIYILLVIVMEAFFIIITPVLADFLYNNNDAWDYSLCYTLTLFVNFLALLFPLYKFVKNLKFIEKVLIDNERKAEAKGSGDLKRRSMRFHQEFIKINKWLLIVGLDFTILLILPNKVDFWGHILVLGGGIAVIVAIYFYKYWNRD